MNIELRISQVKYAYQAVRSDNIPPRKLLVGQSESEELFERAKFHTGTTFTASHVRGNRLQYQGMKVYVVDDETYLWCAP